MSASHGPPPARDDTPRLSVVIPCFNAADSLPRTVRALTAQDWHHPWEIIVADNGSSDETPRVVGDLIRETPRLRLVDASGRRGAAHARNIGARAARGRSVTFFDADDLPHDGWVAAMGDALERHAFVACRLDTETLNEPWTIEVRGRPQSSGLLPTDYPPYLPAASGGTVGISREVFLAVGGFDEDLPLSGEDVEFCWRVQLAGHRLVFVPDAVVSMRFRHRLGEIFEQARRYGFGQPAVYERYRHVTPPTGFAQPPQRRERQRWDPRHIASRLGEVRSRGGRARWVWRLGWYLGVAQGRRARRR